jgi:hypothetical protein
LRGGPFVSGVACCGCGFGFSALPFGLDFLFAGEEVLLVFSSSSLSEESEEREDELDEDEEEETTLFLLRTVRFFVGASLSSSEEEEGAWALFGSGLRATPFLREGSARCCCLGGVSLGAGRGGGGWYCGMGGLIGLEGEVSGLLLVCRREASSSESSPCVRFS